MRNRKFKSGPIINGGVKKVHDFIEQHIVDIPDLTPEQKEKIRQYSLDLAAIVTEAAVKAFIESLKEEMKNQE